MKCGGKPEPRGRAQMVEGSQGCERSSTLRRGCGGQMAFSSPLKARSKKSDVANKGQALC